jgi:hypothetical protein
MTDGTLSLQLLKFGGRLRVQLLERHFMAPRLGCRTSNKAANLPRHVPEAHREGQKPGAQVGQHFSRQAHQRPQSSRIRLMVLEPGSSFIGADRNRPSTRSFGRPHCKRDLAHLSARLEAPRGGFPTIGHGSNSGLGRLQCCSGAAGL